MKRLFAYLTFILTVLSVQTFAQSPVQTITGRVIDSNGEEIIGASVIQKDTQNGTITDIDGHFTINVPLDATLEISFLGHVTTQVKARGKNNLLITLAEDSQILDEVVVVGYGTQRKKDVTGALASVSMPKLEGVSLKSVDQMLQGRASGVHMVQNSGMPGAGSTVRIRGGNSISGGNEPLYVIDGVPIYPSATTSQSNLNPLNTIAITDIESIDILKDASSTAIYGARGANGVIMITTKRGKIGKTNVSFDAYYGIQSATEKYDLMNAAEFEKMANEANINSGGNAVFDETNPSPTTDWQALVLRDNSPIQNYQLSISGGDEKTKFLTSFNYYKQEGIVRATNMDKMTLRSNLDREISNALKYGLSLSLARVKSNRAGMSALEGMMVAPPNIPVMDEDGKYSKQNRMGEIFTNPVAVINDMVNKNTQFRVLVNAYAEWEIIKNLRLRSTFGTDILYSDIQTYTPQTINAGEVVGGDATASSDNTYMWLNENTLTYSWKKGIHALNFLAGFTQQTSKWKHVGAGAQGFLNDNLLMNDLSSGTTPKTPSTGISQWSLMSYLARVNYNLNEKYLLTGSFRADGSSRFGSNNRWGYFPSVALAWRASEEEFIKKLNIFSNFKIRLSYGMTGNQDGIGTYPSLAMLDKMPYVFGDSKYMGYGPSQVQNPDLKWETTRQTDFGIDMGFFDNRLNVTIDAYYKKTVDLLLKVKLPATSGFDSGLKNIGSVENKGIEFNVNARPVQGAFNWDIDFNISFNRNKVLDLGGEDEIIPAGGTNRFGMNLSRLLKVGQPLGIFYGYVGDGTFSTTDDIPNSAQPKAKPGDIKYKDISGPDGVPDNVINDYDRQVIGCAQPDFYGGISNTFSYKNIDLSVFIVGSYGNDIYNANKARMEGVNGSWNQYKTVNNRWTEDNQNTKIPRALAAKETSRSWDYLVEDGSYLRIQNIQLGYNFTPAMLKKIKYLQSARLYVSLQNFFTFTNYSGLDPEVSLYGQDNVGMGYDFGGYPTAKTVMFGVNLNF